MFTGIIQEVGTVKKVTQRPDGIRVAVETKTLKPARGASVATNGVCLTVAECSGTVFSADIVRETIEKSNLGSLAVGEKVNIEPSLRLGDELSGHIVSGHVDATCTVRSLVKKNGATELTVKIPEKLSRFVAVKGSITLQGVSLTVARKNKNEITVALVPFTLNNTTLGIIKKGALLNLEIDTIARYLDSLTQKP